MKECFETRYLSIKDKAVSFVSSCSTIFEIFEKEQIYFSIKFPARERSFASLLPSSTLFNFFKYLNSSHSDQHFPPFLFPTISNREFLQDEFARSCKKFVLKFDSDRSSSLLFSWYRNHSLNTRRKQIDITNESLFSTARRFSTNEQRFRRIGNFVSFFKTKNIEERIVGAP